MKTYWIGRRENMDIRINHPSISSRHAELVVTDDGRFHLTDCASTNGIYWRHQGLESAIKQAYVGAHDWLLLGQVETTVNKLLALAGKASSPGKVVRNVVTGEIEEGQ